MRRRNWRLNSLELTKESSNLMLIKCGEWRKQRMVEEAHIYDDSGVCKISALKSVVKKYLHSSEMTFLNELL